VGLVVTGVLDHAAFPDTRIAWRLENRPANLLYIGKGEDHVGDKSPEGLVLNELLVDVRVVLQQRHHDAL
jgi:hypothetical protein